MLENVDFKKLAIKACKEIDAEIQSIESRLKEHEDEKKRLEFDLQELLDRRQRMEKCYHLKRDPQTDENNGN